MKGGPPMKKSSAWIRMTGLALAVAALAGPGLVSAQGAGDPLAQGFANPPDSARPRVWWHWMSGNITKEGIKADLEWMKRAGVAGFQNFDAGLDTPQIVARRLIYMTPAWKDAFKFTAMLADELGLEMAIAGSPGWSESGGPWVTPKQAMKKYVWSETRLEGGRPFDGLLPKPPSTTGPYQNIPTGRDKEPRFYADSAVVAFRLPDGDRTMAELGAKVASSAGAFDLAALTDGDCADGALLPAAPVNEKAWIQYRFDSPVTVRGITMMTERKGRRMNFGVPELEASDNGSDFRMIGAVPPGATTLAVAPTSARVFRVVFPTLAPRPGAAQAADEARPEPVGTQVSELVLHTV